MAEDTTSRVLTGTRALFAATILGALFAGYIGLREYVAHLPEGMFGTGFWNLAYYDLQLFVLGSEPLEQPGPYPLPLDLARFAAPAATIYALFEAARAIFTGQFRRWRVRRRRGNIIVVGQSTAARALAARLRTAPQPRARRRVVEVSIGEPELLRSAGIARAEVVYAFADDAEDSLINVATALAAAHARRADSRARLRVYAHVPNATLALALRARRLGLPEQVGAAVDFVNLNEMAARGMVSLDDVTIDPGHPAHIVVAGLGICGQAVVVEYARHWRLRSPRRGERVALTLVDPQASVLAADLTARWEVVREVCDLIPVEATAPSVPAGPAPHRVYLCHDDEELALSTALTAVKLWRGGPGSIVVRLDRLSRHAEAFHAPGTSIVEGLGGRLRLVRLTEIACDPAVIAQDLVERLAQAVHERYLLEQLAKGVRLDDPDRPAMRDWSALTESIRNANRAQAGDIGGKLALVGATVAPCGREAEPFAFSASEVERLAIREHDRWLAERRAAGLRSGARRAGKRHPSLVPWAQLPESERDKDREAVRNLPAVLAEVGLQAVRLTGPASV